jgi:hypothetical protein
MANATIAVGTYSGEAARPYVAAAIMSADTLANGYISTLENVHGTAVLRVFSGAAIQAATCTFATGDTQLVLGEAILSTAALKINEQVCNKDLRATWESAQMRGQSSAAPGDFTTYVAQYVAAKVAEGIEHNIWSGNYNPDAGTSTGATYTAFNGIMRNIVLGSPTYESNLGGALTAATILAKLAILTSTGCPTTIQGDYENTKIFMSRSTHALYYDALAAVYNLPFLAEGMANKYKGYEVIVPNGFPDDTLLISKIDNLYFGTDLLTDHINASVLDLTGVTGDDVTRVIMQFSGGTQVVDLEGLGVLRRTT